MARRTVELPVFAVLAFLTLMYSIAAVSFLRVYTTTLESRSSLSVAPRSGPRGPTAMLIVWQRSRSIIGLFFPLQRGSRLASAWLFEYLQRWSDFGCSSADRRTCSTLLTGCALHDGLKVKRRMKDGDSRCGDDGISGGLLSVNRRYGLTGATMRAQVAVVSCDVLVKGPALHRSAGLGRGADAKATSSSLTNVCSPHSLRGYRSIIVSKKHYNVATAEPLHSNIPQLSERLALVR